MNVNDFFKRNKRVVVFDTEYTTWEGALERNWSGEDEHREIFQLCALSVDLEHGEIVDSFERFVYPRKNPLLSDYAKQLTNITQEQVDHGVDFAEMYSDFLAWAHLLPLCSYDPFGSEHGDGNILKENIDLYKLDVPYSEHRYFNVAPLFNEAGIDVQNFTSGQLHTCFDVEVPGHVHDALHDVHSLAISLIALQEPPSDIEEILRHR